MKMERDCLSKKGCCSNYYCEIFATARLYKWEILVKKPDQCTDKETGK